MRSHRFTPPRRPKGVKVAVRERQGKWFWHCPHCGMVGNALAGYDKHYDDCDKCPK